MGPSVSQSVSQSVGQMYWYSNKHACIHTWSYLHSAVRSKPKRGHCALLVMPSSVLVQWKQELLKARHVYV